MCRLARKTKTQTVTVSRFMSSSFFWVLKLVGRRNKRKKARRIFLSSKQLSTQEAAAEMDDRDDRYRDSGRDRFRDDRGSYRDDRGGYRDDRGGYRDDRGGYRGDSYRDGGYRGFGGGGSRSGYGGVSSAPPRRRGDRFHNEDAKEKSSTLFVGGIPYSFRESDMEQLFEKFGRVEKTVIGVDRRTGRPKGFGFVTFEDRRDAEDAYDRMQNYELEGRRLRLDFDVGLEQKQRMISKWEGRRLESQGKRKSRSRTRSRSPRRSRSRTRSRSRSPRNSRSRSRSRSPARGGSRSPSPRRSRSASRGASRSPPPRPRSVSPA